jgi:hypothetical protein
MLFSLIPNFKSLHQIPEEMQRLHKCGAKYTEVHKTTINRNISPLRIIIRSHFISRALVFLIRLEIIEAFSDLSRTRNDF